MTLILLVYKVIIFTDECKKEWVSKKWEYCFTENQPRIDKTGASLRLKILSGGPLNVFNIFWYFQRMSVNQVSVCFLEVFRYNRSMFVVRFGTLVLQIYEVKTLVICGKEEWVGSKWTRCLTKKVTVMVGTFSVKRRLKIFTAIVGLFASLSKAPSKIDTVLVIDKSFFAYFFKVL